MPRDAGLRPHEAPVADLGGARDARLGDEARVAPDLDVVPDLDEVVDLRHGADVGAADARAVDRRVGADLDAVPDLDDAKLGDLLDVDRAVLAASVVEAVAVAAEADAAVDDAVGADDRALAEGHLRVDVGLRADPAALADEDLGLDYGAGADLRALLDHGPGSDVDAFAYLRGGVDDGGRVHPRGADRFRRREHPGRRHAGAVGVRDADYRARRAERPLGRQQHGGRLRGLDEPDVLRVLAEAEVPGAGLLQPAAGAELDVLALKRAAERGGDLTCLHSSPSRPRPSRGRRPSP